MIRHFFASVVVQDALEHSQIMLENMMIVRFVHVSFNAAGVQLNLSQCYLFIYLFNETVV